MKDNNKKSSKQFKVFLSITILVSAVIFLYIWLTRTESLYQATKRLHEAVWNGDVDVIMRYMRDDEIEMNQLTRENFKNFVDTIFKKNLEGFTPDKNIDYDMIESTGVLTSSRIYRHPDGRFTALYLLVYKTDKNPIVRRLIEQMLFTVIYTHTDPTKPLPTGKEQMLFNAETIDKMLSDLQKTGLPGIVRKERDDSYRFYSWDQWKNYWLNAYNKRAQ